MAAVEDVKVYTVNGAAAGSSSSLPDWLTRKRAASGKGKKRAIKEQIEGSIELIQGFEFAEASNRVKTTRDGHNAVATGTYKPQIKVWDLDQLSLKFERHTDAENIDFVLLSDDWTKSIHLQNDRTLELHTQGGFHYRTRIPRFGRALAYHFNSCDTFVAAAGNEIYRLNLDQGRFMTPLQLSGDVEGVNTLDINPAHQLLSLAIEAEESVRFWDVRSRSSVGSLRLPQGTSEATSIASKQDGLTYAIGTQSGVTLLYDIRAARPFATKEQGYGLPVKHISWIEGGSGSKMAGDSMVITADRKVIKIWERNNPTQNFTSITPAADINDVHHVPGSGLLLLANEAINMNSYYIPQLGPAPRWASFLENITEEMELGGEGGTGRSVYEDFKFVGREELSTLGLSHLVGTPTLKPYMHGYFLSLKLYDAARLIANPFVYEEERAKTIQRKLDAKAEGRIRSAKNNVNSNVKVNKKLAEKFAREEEKSQNRLTRRREAAAAEDEPEPVDGDIEMNDITEKSKSKNVLTDPRFAKLFSDPAFAVDEESREWALMNPSSTPHATASNSKSKTAVEDEEEESEKESSDGLDGSSDDDDKSGNGSDSSEEGELNSFDPRARPGQTNPLAQQAYARNRESNRLRNADNTNKITYVPVRTQGGPASGRDKNITFGQRKAYSGSGANSTVVGKAAAREEGMEVSWVPSTSAREDRDPKKRKESKRKGVEEFGAGMEKGGEDPSHVGNESDRKGRTQRRQGVRSGSRNVFRKMD